jgi:hypothetical protein
MPVSEFGKGVGRFSSPLRGVEMPAMPHMGQDTMRYVQSFFELSLGADALQLVISSLAVGVFSDHGCVADGPEVTSSVSSRTAEMFRKDKGLEMWLWIVDATEPPHGEESLLPACTEA